MRMLRTGRWIGATLGGLLTLLIVPTICRSQETPPVTSESGYAYVSLTEGGVTLVEFDTGEFVAVEGTEALLVGDELRLSPGARAEVQLSDRNSLRLADQAEVVFLTLAGSPDRNDAATALRLGRGALQIQVAADYVGQTPPAIETANAYVELRGPGSYVIDSQGTDRTLVVVREGSARVRAGTAVTPLRAGEEAVVEGTDGARIRLASARGLLAVERWGDQLNGRYAGTTEVYVDESIRYAAAPLHSYGTWVYVRGTRAWRPRVAAGWRPYTNGRWRYTRTGVLWVSYEPWGWVPHHYGSWDLVPGFGWVWFPGRVFASAWVYWYWGPKYVGWVPWGYYSHRHRGRFGFAFGVYGVAGGLATHFGDWCFTPIHRFGDRHQRRHIRYGRDLGRDRERLAKGIITTDTRNITPIEWTSPERVTQLLAYDDKGEKRPLDDVSPFIDRQRRRDLTDNWKPAASDPGARTRASIDPVRPARLAGVTREQTSARETAREELKRRPSIDPVRPTRLAGVTREQTSARETAREELKRRPSVDPVRPSRTVQVPTAREPASRERAVVTPRSTTPSRTRPTVERSQKTQPRVEERSTSRVPQKVTGPESVRGSKAATTAAPKRQNATRSPATRSSTRSSTPRTMSRQAPRSKPSAAKQAKSKR